jgi:Acetyltransferase (GNAT) family
MNLVFSQEPFSAVLDDILPLFEAHWHETEMYRSGHKMKPDMDRYLRFSDEGFYQMFTARDGGKLVGDAGMYVTVSMHEQTKTAVEDTWFLMPEYRLGRNAINFLRFVEDELRSQGVRDIYMTTKLSNGAGRILEFCKYKHVANQYWKEL